MISPSTNAEPQAELLRGAQALLPRRVLHAGGARAGCAPNPQSAFAAPPRRTGPLQRRLPRSARNSPAWCSNSVRPHAAARADDSGQPAARRSPRCWRRMALIAVAARADPGRSASRAHRPGAEPSAGRAEISRTWSRETLIDAIAPLPDDIARPGAKRWPRARSRSSRWPEARAAAGPEARAWSRRSIRFASSGGKHRSFSKCTWPKAVARPRVGGQPLPHIFTTSYLPMQAIEEHLRRHENYGYPGPLLLSPGRGHRAAHDSHGARPAFRVGGNAAADARRAGPESAREPARHINSVGAPGGRRQRLHR